MMLLVFSVASEAAMRVIQVEIVLVGEIMFAYTRFVTGILFL